MLTYVIFVYYTFNVIQNDGGKDMKNALVFQTDFGLADGAVRKE